MAFKLPGAGLQLLHAVHGEPLHLPHTGALLPFAYRSCLTQATGAHCWESVPTVALGGLQASVDVGPAGQSRGLG